MLGTMTADVTADSVRARIAALRSEHDALGVQRDNAKASADALAFDAEEDDEIRRERTRDLELVATAEHRMAEIEAALTSAESRVGQIAAGEERARKAAAAREAARLADQRMKAARRFDRSMAEAEKAFQEYAALEPRLAANLLAANVADSITTRLLSTRAARAVRFAAWAQAPALATLLGIPRATVGNRSSLTDAERTLLPDLKEFSNSTEAGAGT